MITPKNVVARTLVIILLFIDIGVYTQCQYFYDCQIKYNLFYQHLVKVCLQTAIYEAYSVIELTKRGAGCMLREKPL